MPNNSFYHEFLADFDSLIRTTPGYKTLSTEFDKIDHFEAINGDSSVIVDTVELTISSLRFNVTFTHRRYEHDVACKFEAYLDDRLLVKITGSQDIIEDLQYIGNIVMLAAVGRE